MRVCDRCGNKATYNLYVHDAKHDLCGTCYKKLHDLQKIFTDLEGDFMKKKFTSIKRIEFEYMEEAK